MGWFYVFLAFLLMTLIAWACTLHSEIRELRRQNAAWLRSLGEAQVEIQALAVRRKELEGELTAARAQAAELERRLSRKGCGKKGSRKDS